MTSENRLKRKVLNRKILQMTFPTVLSNISVPLLGLCDTAVAGHMGDEKYLAGIAIGSVMVTTMYWLFSFLRAGTSGLTATSYGAKDQEGMGYSLLRSLLLAFGIGVLLMAIHTPMLRLLQNAMGASPEVTELSGRYFSICIMGAVPMMVLTAFTGWFIGMQSTTTAMAVNIGMSVLNIFATLLLVYGLGFGFKGIAYGTLAAQWLILLPAIWMAIGLCRKKGVVFRFERKRLLDGEAWKQMFNVNSNLFFRSACLIALTMMLYAFSARLGDVEVSANAVINQLFLFFSYFMDGFAFTGEALVGRYHGAQNERMLRLSIRSLLRWTAAVTRIFLCVYVFGLSLIVKLLTDSADVLASVKSCAIWVILMPLAGCGAFIYDGFYIGLTKTAPMLISTLCGVALFMILLMVVPHTQWMLWMAFNCYLALRSILLIALFPLKSWKPWITCTQDSKFKIQN